MNIELITKGLTLLSETPKLVEKLPTMPNMNFPTMGGKVFWNDLVNVNGWRVQKNNITGHCRVLDPENVRHAWGGEEDIMNLFEKLLKD